MIYQHTQGYPRRIANLCHLALEELVITERSFVEEDMIVKIVECDRKIGLDD